MPTTATKTKTVLKTEVKKPKQVKKAVETDVNVDNLNWFDKFMFELNQLVPENRKIKRVINLFKKYEKSGRDNLTEEDLDKLETLITGISLSPKDEFVLFNFYEPKVKGLTDIGEINGYIQHNFSKKLKVYKNKERELDSGLGSYLKSLRKEMGLTLADVKNLSQIDISASYISRIENSSRLAPSLAFLKDLARIYKRPLSEVLQKAGMQLDESTSNKSVELMDLVMENSIKVNGKRMGKEKKKALMDKVYALINEE